MKRKSVAAKKEWNKESAKESTNESITEEKHYTPVELEMEAKAGDYFQMNCDLCLHQFVSWNDTRGHYLDKHNVLKPFLRCCNRKFFLRSRIIEHITWHVDPSAFQYVYGSFFKNFIEFGISLILNIYWI